MTFIFIFHNAVYILYDVTSIQELTLPLNTNSNSKSVSLHESFFFKRPFHVDGILLNSW